MNATFHPYSDPQIEDDVCRWLLHDFQGIADRFPELQADYLTQAHTRAVYSVVKAIHDEGHQVDMTISLMEAMGRVAEESKPLILDLATEFNLRTGGVAFSYCVGKLRDHWKRRTIRNATSDISVADPNEAAAILREALDAVADPPPPPPSMEDALRAWADNLQELAAGRKKPGIATNIPGLDSVTCGGMRPGELWILGGPTSSGKTALEIQMAGNLLDDGNGVFVASLEMPIQQIIDRFVCNRSGVFLGKLKDPSGNPLTQLDLGAIGRVVKKMSQDWRFEIHDETCDISVILDSARAMKQRSGLDVLVVDYLQIATTSGTYQTRERECADISRSLKRFAMSENVTVIALSQLNDAGEIRESRAIAHDADVVIKIVEDGVCVQKNRSGQSSVVLPLVLDGRRQTFVERKDRAA